MIEQILLDFQIPQKNVLSITTDNASNMICGIKKLNELNIQQLSDEDTEKENEQINELLNCNLPIAHMRCAPHTWQLVVKQALVISGSIELI